MSSNFPCLESNPDISGVGVRIAFYIQTTSSVVLVGRSLSEALPSLWTLLGTSFGLTISAIVTAAQSQLPLYQAIIVTYLVWLSNFAVFLAHASYARCPNPPKLLKYFVITQTYFSLGVSLCMWARAPQFRSNGANVNDHTVFIVLFVKTSALGNGRIAGLVVVSALILAYTAFLVYLLMRARHPQKRRESSRRPSKQRDALPPNPIDPHLAALIALFFPVLIVSVISIELQVGQNMPCARNLVWGFGQVLALVVSVLPVLTMVSELKKHGIKEKQCDEPTSQAHAHHTA